MNGKFYKKITGYFYLKDSVGNKTKEVKKHYKKKSETELNRLFEEQFPLKEIVHVQE